MAGLGRQMFELRFRSNLRLHGRGEDAVVSLPCPFCAAPEWYTVSLSVFGEGEMAPHVCPECHRSARFLFVRDGDSVSCELVQCGGDAPPDWLQPMPRRENVESEPPHSAGWLEPSGINVETG